ncbi:hypothetical protein BCR33DRAFT_496854 [Rhizoclosmatium globosum]|uniref:U-box domain-containing protein n=1 Tax=Rhizoclosmatium globosum TaxID=329046 RepID=A0A1Y2CUV9_9FUNG|nr:hypothetical protein BCR33DRAFT_496854 [Rhizoclosmatium globosum]|eukprot:ORY50850.1 hypothetical protein BCR33DRAFT_496854 [Rhizoclosmatium globosum]
MVIPWWSDISEPATSPVTGVRLTSRAMTSNEVIKKLSRAWNQRGTKDPTPELTKILTCPLSGKLFVDPVLCADGYSYERDHIKKHYDKSLDIHRLQLRRRRCIPCK